MNMKSITAAAQSISFIPFVFSLRMRKQIENEMKLKGIAAQGNSPAAAAVPAEAALFVVWLIDLLFILWWVIGGSPP